MKLKYFEEVDISPSEQSEYEKEIIFGEKVFSITKEKSGDFIITEECDGYFGRTLTKEEAIEMLEEAISWIKEG